jgi:hypothetical protein
MAVFERLQNISACQRTSRTRKMALWENWRWESKLRKYNRERELMKDRRECRWVSEEADSTAETNSEEMTGSEKMRMGKKRTGELWRNRWDASRWFDWSCRLGEDLVSLFWGIAGRDWRFRRDGAGGKVLWRLWDIQEWSEVVKRIDWSGQMRVTRTLWMGFWTWNGRSSTFSLR